MLAVTRREFERILNPSTDLASSVVTSQQVIQSGFAEELSLLSVVAVAGLRIVKVITDFLGLDFSTHLAPLMAAIGPPFFTTLGWSVQRADFEEDGMPVYRLPSPLSALFNPSASQDVIVVIHGARTVLSQRSRTGQIIRCWRGPPARVSRPDLSTGEQTGRRTKLVRRPTVRLARSHGRAGPQRRRMNRHHSPRLMIALASPRPRQRGRRLMGRDPISGSLAMKKEKTDAATAC